MFKVVADQLKVSRGWVRCGHCADVFDGSAHLLPEEAVMLPPSALTPDDVPAVGQTPTMRSAEVLEAAADRAPSMPLRHNDAQDSVADFDPASWKQVQQERQQHEVEPVPVPDTVSSTDAPLEWSALTQTAKADESGFESSGRVDSEAAPEVSFVRNARRKVFWRKPLIRWSLGGLSFLLFVTLVLQGVIQQKDSLAVFEPRLVPLLQRLCSHLHCEIRPPRHIESLVIDNSTFNKIGPDVYRLSFTLKNTGAMALEIPAMEVTLTDSQDQALVRRVLTPAQFGAIINTLANHSELVGVVTMKVSVNGDGGTAPPQPPAPFRVAGYRILAFYP